MTLTETFRKHKTVSLTVGAVLCVIILLLLLSLLDNYTTVTDSKMTVDDATKNSRASVDPGVAVVDSIRTINNKTASTTDNHFGITLKNILNTLITLFTSILIGVIFSLISSFYLKKEDEEILKAIISERLSYHLEESKRENERILNNSIKNQLSYYLPAIQQIRDDEFLGIKKIERLDMIDVSGSILIEKSTIKLMFISFDFKILGDETKKIIRHLLKEESDIQLLLLHPQSSAFQARCQERNKQKYKNYYELRTLDNHKEFLSNFRDLFGEGRDSRTIYEDKITVKFMNYYPTYIYINIANYLWFTPVWTLESSVKKPMICLNNKSSSLFKAFDNQFDKLWMEKDNLKVDVSDLSSIATKLYEIYGLS